MYNDTKKTKSNPLLSTVIILGLIIMVAGTYHYLQNNDKIIESIFGNVEKAEETPVVETANTTLNESTSLPTTSQSQTTTTAPLPLLNDSDTTVLTATQQLVTLFQHRTLLVKQDIIRNIVVFVDNFSRGELALNFSPLFAPTEAFSIVERDEKIYISKESYSRYDIYAEFINTLDVKSLVNQYHTLQPLFDEAYQEIGYPDKQFDSKLYEAIQVVLGTPVISEPIPLVAPSVMYKFADPELEALPDAQKLLIRMGPDNILKLKTKLLQIQAAL